MYTVDEIFSFALQIERNGESFYRRGLEEVSDPRVKALLLRLADDERRHTETFARMREDLKGKPAAGPLNPVLLDILGDQSFSLKETDLTRIDTTALIQAALEFENDTILFYELLRGLTLDGGTSAQLERIIGEERRHIEILEEMGAGV